MKRIEGFSRPCREIMTGLADLDNRACSQASGMQGIGLCGRRFETGSSSFGLNSSVSGADLSGFETSLWGCKADSCSDQADFHRLHPNFCSLLVNFCQFHFNYCQCEVDLYDYVTRLSPPATGSSGRSEYSCPGKHSLRGVRSGFCSLNTD